MTDLIRNYLELCEQYKTDTQDCITSQLHQLVDEPKKKSLDFSSNSLTPQSCAVIGKLLSNDVRITELRFTDCMLTDEAVKALCHGLASNTTCRKLDLKGNNIRAKGAEAMGRLIQKTKTIKSLCLDWNAIGMLEISMSVFTECLAANTSITYLDLRNNQISHDGACELASALKRNTTLFALDLRWNNIGIIGGRAVHQCMELNKTLSKLEINGNNVPTDILKAIDSCVQANAERAKMALECRNRTQILGRQIESLKIDKQAEMLRMMDMIDNQENQLLKTTRSTSHKIGQLQEALEERKTAINSLNAKLSMVESQLAVSEAKLSDANLFVSQLQQEMDSSREWHLNEIKKEREEKQIAETKLLKETFDLREKNAKLESRADDSERKYRSNQEQVFELKEQLAHAQAEVKLKAAQFDERLAHEKQRFKDLLRESEQSKEKELAKAKEDNESCDKSLRDRIQRMEQQRLELEDEITRLKNQFISEKLQHEDHIMTLKHKIRQEEDQRQSQMDEKCRLLQATKDELQSRNTSLTGQLSDLQARHSQFSLENESLKCRISDLQTDLSGKNNELMSEVGRVKVEYTHRIQRLEQERETQSDLYNRIKALEKQLEDERSQSKKTVALKDKDVQSLNEQVKQKDAEITRMQQDEEQRAHMLQQAVLGFLRKPTQ